MSIYIMANFIICCILCFMIGMVIGEMVTYKVIQLSISKRILTEILWTLRDNSIIETLESVPLYHRIEVYRQLVSEKVEKKLTL